MKKYSILIYILLSFYSCKKENTSNTNEFSKADYPIKIGNWWRYQVADFMQQTTDTLMLKVVSLSNTNNQEVYTCQLILNNQIVDTGYYTISSDRIEYSGFRQDYSYFGNFTLTLPFQVGFKWIGVNPKDTVKALSRIATFRINGKDYSPIYNLKRSYNLAGGYKITQNFIVSPKVGIVYQTLDIFDGFPTQKQGFQLIDYELN